MAVTLNANTSTGFIATSDTSGVLQLQTGGTTAVTVDASQRTAFVAGTAALPVITTAGDTNTGIFFPAADTIAFSEGGVEAMRIDSAGNMGLGVTPSAWNSAFRALQIGNYGAHIAGRTDSTNQLWTGTNAYYNGSNFIYTNTAAATQYTQSNGTHLWYTAASGTAGNTISFTQAMTLDASGNLGIGTSSPVGRLNIAAADTSNVIGSATASLNITNTDIAAFGRTVNLNFTVGNGNLTDRRLAGISAIYTSFSTTTAGALAFSTDNGSGSFAERARITAAGDFLVGKNTAAVSSGGNGLYVAANGFVGTNIPSSLADTFNIYNSTAAVYRFYVTQGGTIFATSTTISAISDQRLKENVQDLDVGLDAVMALKPRKFDWKEGKGKDIKGDRGWIAQEFEQVFPDMIDEWKDESPEGEDPYKSVRADLIPVLVKAIQEQQAIIQTLTDRITVLEGTTP